MSIQASSSYFTISQITLIECFASVIMEIFTQLVWTANNVVLGDFPSVDNAWEPAPSLAMQGASFADLPMADYPPPSPVTEAQMDDSFDPENLPEGKHTNGSYLILKIHAAYL